MSPLRCLITGADFLDTDHQRWIHGDLHQLLDTMIFDATGCQWNYVAEKPLPESSMTLRADHFHEKNNVLSFPLQLTLFNDNANNYLTEMLNKVEKDLGPMISVIMVDLGKPNGH
jgi:hypothetical protein